MSRPRGYKNTAVACEAMRQRGNDRLVVVGALPPTPLNGWGPSITVVTGISDALLRWLFAR